MITYIGIAFAAVLVIARWAYFHTLKKQELKPEAIDAEFMNLLNNGDPHE